MVGRVPIPGTSLIFTTTRLGESMNRLTAPSGLLGQPFLAQCIFFTPDDAPILEESDIFFVYGSGQRAGDDGECQARVLGNPKNAPERLRA